MNSKCLWLRRGTDGRVWGSQPQDSSLRAPSPWPGPWTAPGPSVTWGWWGLLGQEEEALRGLGEASRRCNEDTGEGRGARLPGPPSFFPAEAQLTGTHSEFGRAGPPGRRVQLQRSLSALSQPRAQARGAEARRGGPRGWWDWAGRGGGPAGLPGALSAHWKISRLRVPWSEGLAPRWASVSPSSLTHPGATAAWGDH